MQTLSSASFSGLAIGPTTSKPTAAFSACTAVLRTSGSTTTRRVAGSAKSHAMTVLMHRPGEAVHGSVGGRAEEVHADVAGLAVVEAGQLDVGRVVALHEEGGLAR